VTALVPVIVISATQVALFGIVLPLLMLGPVVASRTRPQPQQLAFAALLLIPTLLLSSGFLAWWAVSWMDAVEAPVPALTGIGLVVAVTAGLLAPLRLPGASGPFWLKPLLGFSAGVLVPVAIMESVLVGLPTFAAAAVGAAVLGLLVVVFRIMARPLAERRRAQRIRKAVQRFDGQLVDLVDGDWRLTGARGEPGAIALNYLGKVDGRDLGATLLLRRDMSWVPVSIENEAAVFELARGLNGQPTEAVLAQQQLGTPATLTLRIPGTTVLSIRESVPDSLSWVEFVNKLELVDGPDLLRRHLGEPNGAPSADSERGPAPSE
jgi:hypothetical protein